MQANPILFLTGYRGTGKSTIGRLLAEMLGGAWLDIDDSVEQRAAMRIAEMFAQKGEAYFRDWETRCLRDAVNETSPNRPAVISLGGGAVIRQENRLLIQDSGKCVWLTASSKTLASRLVADASSDVRRPSLTGLPADKEIDEVLAVRTPWYREVADIEISTEDRTPDQLASSILEWWGRVSST